MIIGKATLHKYANLEVDPRRETAFSLYDSEKYYFSSKDRNKSIEFLTSELFKELNVGTSSVGLDAKSLGKVYINPSATLPRYKLRSLKDDYGVNIVRDPSKADTIVISKNELTEISDMSYGRSYYSKEKVIEFLSMVTPNTVRRSYTENPGWYARTFISQVTEEKSYSTVQEIITALKALPEDISIIHISSNNLIPLLENIQGDIETIGGHYLHTFKKSDIDKLINSFKDKRVYTDNAIESLLGSGALDHESYEMIDKLFRTNDRANIDLAFTMMANCSFESSKPYLMLLLSDHFSLHRDKPYVKSVAFKSLLNFMDFSRWSSYTNDDVLFAAEKCDQLTEELKAIMLKRYLDDVRSVFNRSAWFKITGYELKAPDDTDKRRN